MEPYGLLVVDDEEPNVGGLGENNYDFVESMELQKQNNTIIQHPRQDFNGQNDRKKPRSQKG